MWKIFVNIFILATICVAVDGAKDLFTVRPQEGQIRVTNIAEARNLFGGPIIVNPNQILFPRNPIKPSLLDTSDRFVYFNQRQTIVKVGGMLPFFSNHEVIHLRVKNEDVIYAIERVLKTFRCLSISAFPTLKPPRMLPVDGMNFLFT